MSHDRDELSSNPSSNRRFADVVAARWSRRDILRGGLGAAAVGFITGPVVLEGVAHAGSVLRSAASRRQVIGFTAVPPSSSDAIVVPPEYTAEVLIPWGTPLQSDGPAWRKDASNSAAEQAQQVGMHHDGMHYFPLERGPGGSSHGLLVLNHEYVDRTILYQDGDAVMTSEKVAKALAAHGVTVIEISSDAGTWQQVDSPYNRRITGTTPVTFSGPVAADHPMLQANDPPAGTLNNCAYGHTPWGTYLACEENFDGYFGTADTTFVPRPDELRYGVDRSDSGFRWFTADRRFDVAVNRNEPNRFGWVVEIDPFDPRSTPVKRTALGRIKHEGALVTESRGRVVVYMGDDQDGDYIYKFVGAGAWKSHQARGRSPLDHGKLFVARFNDDGTGDWLPLVHGEGPLTSANGFADQADVLLRTRQAADAVGPTKMDRPEWIAENPNDGSLYVSLTNSTSDTNAANPRTPNPYGHIVRWHEERGDNTRTRFRWDIFVLAGDPQYDPQVTLAEEDIFGSPDGLWFDDDGRLWIQTDISNSSQNRADRGYDRIGNNQMLVANTETGEIRRFLTGPRGCEITGIIATPDQRTLFVNVQHPGEATDFWGAPTPANPRAVSNWPDFDPEGRPRAATVVIRRHDGGTIGT